MRGFDVRLTKQNKSPALASLQEQKLAVGLLIPIFAIILIVLVFPIFYSLILRFSDVNIRERSLDPVGFANYAKLFSDKIFMNALGRTFWFTGVSVALEMVIGVGMALVLHEKFKGRNFLRGIIILPWALPSVVNAIMWKWIYHPNYGALNALLSQLGIIDKYQVWINDWAMECIIFANVWKETPYVVLLTIAALATVDKSIYEAAKVDGAGAVRSLFSITLPVIKPVLISLIIIKTIWAIQTFDLVYIMTNGGPAGSTELVALTIYKTMFKFNDFGYAAAMSYALMFIMFILTYLYIKSQSKDDLII
jgi:multiple sugar transport system permease protein